MAPHKIGKITPSNSLPTTAVVAISVTSAAVLLIIVLTLATWLHRRRRHSHHRHRASLRRAKEQIYQRHQPRALKSPCGAAQTPPPLLVKKTPTPPASKTGSPQSETADSPTTAGAHRQQPETTTVSAIPGAASGGVRHGEVARGSIVSREETAAKTETDSQKDLGQIYFSIRHDPERAVLVVTVDECRHLVARHGTGTTTDPYVKVQLLPGRQQRGKTRVMRNTLSPVFNEEFTFYGLQPNQVQELTFHFIILSFDRYSRDEVLGEVVYAMADAALQGNKTLPQDDGAALEENQSKTATNEGETIRVCMNISPRSIKTPSQNRGELLVSLCTQPAANRLTVVVLKARNLPKMDITGSSDPYVKIYLVQNGRRIAKKKTHVKKRTLSPVFNESFVFDLPDDCKDLSNISLELMLLDWDRVTKNEVIGRLTLGGNGAENNESSKAEDKRISSAVHHWKEMINSPRRQIAEWHKLIE